MTLFHNKKRWLVILALLALHLAVLVYFGVSPADLGKFLLAVVICTVLPGMLFLNGCKLYENQGYKFLLAPIIGISLDILVYIVFSALGCQSLFYPVLGLVLPALLITKKLPSDLRLLSSLVNKMERPHFIVLSLLSLLFLALIVIFQYIPNPLPGGSDSLIYYIDQPWHLGNIAEIKNHWYPQDPRLAGYPFNYHIFVYVFIAFMARVSGITVPVLYFRLGTWFLLALLFAAVYFSGSRWFNKRATGLLHIAAFFFLGTLLLSYPFNLFLTNIFTSPTFLLALIFILALIVEIKTYMEQGGKARLGVILLLVTTLTGAKGNFFPLIFCGLLAYWFYTLLRRKKDTRIVTLLLTTVIPFLAVFFYIFKGGGSEGIHIVPFEVVKYTHLADAYTGWLGVHSDSWLKWGVVPLYIIGFLGFRLPILAEMFANLVSSLPRLRFEQVFIAGTTAASLVSGFLLSYRGRSEYFYLFVGLIGLNLISAGYLYKIYSGCRSKLLQIVITILLAFSALDTGLTAWQLPQVIPELNASSYQPLTPKLYEALTFVRDNTETDALVAGCRAFIYSPDDPRFFYYSGFAERRILAEGWGYMSAPKQAEARARYEDMIILYSTRDEETAGSILKKYSINYVIVENKINQHLWFNTGRYLRLRFENGDTEIYETIE